MRQFCCAEDSNTRSTQNTVYLPNYMLKTSQFISMPIQQVISVCSSQIHRKYRWTLFMLCNVWGALTWPRTWKQFVLIFLWLHLSFGELLFYPRTAVNKRDSELRIIPFNPHLILRCYHGRPAAYSFPSGKPPMRWAGYQSGVRQPGSRDICLDFYQGCH